MQVGIIASGESLSGVINLPAGTTRGIIQVDDWTAAAITFKVALEPNVAVGDHEDLLAAADAAEIIIASFSGGNTFVLPPEVLAAASVVIRSGVTATPVNQGADRTIKIREN